MTYTRRRFLGTAAGLALSGGLSPTLSRRRHAASTRLILLGTKGGPRVGHAGRRNSATLLLIDDVPYLVDCGYGTSLQLLAAGVPLEALRYVFITHHHSDHNLDLGPLAYNAWITGAPLRVDAYGPPGVAALISAFFEALAYDIEVRRADEGRSDPRESVVPHEVHGPGIVLEDAGVRVTAGRVRHPPLEHAYAYRFDSAERSIVISGDTAYAPELIDLARGADVLVHEVMYEPALGRLLRRVPNAHRLREHLLASHTRAEDVGRVAARAGVGTLVLSHLVPGDDPSITDEQWTEGVRRHFSGEIVVGRDLMEI